MGKKVTVPAPVPASYLDHKKQFKIFFSKFCLFMIGEAALLPRNLLNVGNHIHNFTAAVRTFVTVPVSLRQEVTVPTVSVPQQCFTAGFR